MVACLHVTFNASIQQEPIVIGEFNYYFIFSNQSWRNLYVQGRCPLEYIKYQKTTPFNYSSFRQRKFLSDRSPSG